MLPSECSLLYLVTCNFPGDSQAQCLGPECGLQRKLPKLPLREVGTKERRLLGDNRAQGAGEWQGWGGVRQGCSRVSCIKIHEALK